MSILKKEVEYIINLIGFKIIFDYFNYQYSQGRHITVHIYIIYL